MTSHEIVQKQREFFDEGYTLDLRHRRAVLTLLKSSIIENKALILEALKEDLGKSETEAYMCEVGLVLSEINNAIKKIGWWGRKRRVNTPLSNFPAKSYIIREPYGNVLIMSPWNYPFLLCISPLISALAAGNTVVLKPSAYAPATSAAIKKLIEDCFTEDYVAVVEGGREVNSSLLEEKWDYIFFTGSKEVGRIVMGKAAAHLTPVTLELGGKSPVIVDESADIKLAARRIVFGKYLNLGQTCVAPDHVFVHESVAEEFLSCCRKEISAMFGERPFDNADYGKIISKKHYSRLVAVIEDAKARLGEDCVVWGGGLQEEALRIEPTIIKVGALGEDTFDSVLMQEEIFGPIMPVITYTDLGEVARGINSRPRPLATYIFTGSSSVKNALLEELHFGGGCVNDVIMHLATDNMPFGGVGESGIGNYHGKYGYDTFSHLKSITDRGRWCDPKIRYQPYTPDKLKTIKKLL